MAKGSWSENQKFWAETLRIAIFGLIGFLAINFIAEDFKKKTEYEAFLGQERIKLKKDVVDDFLKSSYNYTLVLYDILNEDRDSSIKEQYDIYRIDQNRMKAYFGSEVGKKIQSIDEQLLVINRDKRPSNWIDERKKLKTLKITVYSPK